MFTGAGGGGSSSSSSSSATSIGSNAPAPVGAMMYLKAENSIVAEFLRKRLDPEFPEATEPEDIRITDFDEANLRIEIPEEALSQIRVSLKLHNYADMKDLGIDEYLKQIYGPLLVTPPHDEADITVLVDKKALSSYNLSTTEVISKIANIRKYAVTYPYLKMMNAVASGKGASEKPFVCRTVEREPIYLLPRADRVIVIYHLAFDEPTDRAIARVVAQELTEANRTVNNAPPCSWSEREAPMELKGFSSTSTTSTTTTTTTSSSSSGNSVPKPSTDETSIGFISFSFFVGSYKQELQREVIANQASLFRNFLLYHIKAAKSYLHARMRNRCDGLQRVLNRAIPEDPFADKEKKLASGKTFVRK